MFKKVGFFAPPPLDMNDSLGGGPCVAAASVSSFSAPGRSGFEPKYYLLLCELAHAGLHPEPSVSSGGLLMPVLIQQQTLKLLMACRILQQQQTACCVC